MVVPFLNIPIISVVLLLLAGILIGHLIWYRDRSDDEAAVIGLRGENHELQSALHEHKQAYVSLEADLEDRRKEWDQLKASNKQLELAHQETDHDLSELNNEIARLQQLKDQAFHDLDQERQQRRALQEALTQADQNSSRVDSLTEQLQSQVTAFQTERDEIDQIANARLAEKEKHEAELREQLEALMREREDLQQQLTVQQDNSGVVGQVTAERDNAQLELAETQETVTRLQTQVTAREEDIASLRGERDEYTKQLEDERSSREKIEQQVTRVDQLVSQRDSAVERANTLTSEITDLQQRLESESMSNVEANRDLEKQNEQLNERLTVLTREHDAVATMLVDERTRLSKMEADNHRLSLAATEEGEKSDRATIELKSQIEAQIVELETLRSELEETAAQLSRERHQRQHLQTVLHDRKIEHEASDRERSELEESMRTLTTQNAHLLEQTSELMALRGEHASVKKMLESSAEHLDELRETHELAISQRQELEIRVDEINEQNSRFTQQVAQLVAEKDEYATELDHLQQAYNTALSGRLDLESTADQLREETRALQDRLVEMSELKDSFREQQERLEKVVAQRDEAIDSNAANEEMSAFREQIETQSRSLSALNQQNDQLRTKTTEVDELRRMHLQLQTQLNETADRLRRVTVERDERVALLTTLESRVAQSDARSKANEETIRNLRRERAAVLGRTRQPSLTAIPFVSPSIPEESGGRMRRDEVLGMVYTQPPKRKDDLKRISGIAQVLEKKLNAFGVYTYRQIMEWDSVAVAEFSKLLSFRDRIERDDWIGQARSLYYETYGRAA